MRTKFFLAILIGVVILGALLSISFGFLEDGQRIIEEKSRGNTTLNRSESSPQTTTVVQNLSVPWAMDFLPDGGIIFTERVGRVSVLDEKNLSRPVVIANIDEVVQIGEGGLLGIALHPGFESNRLLYLYYTYGGSESGVQNRVVRFKLEDNLLQEKAVILDNIPGSSNHNGGRMKFGPDGFLYITTGDSENPSLAQDRDSLAGKILRVTDEGRSAPGNPFNNRTFSYGHRNPQGLAWDNQGRLWSTEHGPSAKDELNLIEAGKNYGWPTITGSEDQVGMVQPVINSGSDTWAPAGLAYLNGSLFWGGLRGRTLFETRLDQLTEPPTKHFTGEFGRLREVVVKDGSIFVTTSNRDGRGGPVTGDDRIIRISDLDL